MCSEDFGQAGSLGIETASGGILEFVCGHVFANEHTAARHQHASQLEVTMWGIAHLRERAVGKEANSKLFQAGHQPILNIRFEYLGLIGVLTLSRRCARWHYIDLGRPLAESIHCAWQCRQIRPPENMRHVVYWWLCGTERTSHEKKLLRPNSSLEVPSQILALV